MAERQKVLKFVAYKSCVDPSFWHKLAEIKLNIDKLNEQPRNIWGYCDTTHPRGLNSVIYLNSSSFNQIPDKGHQVIKGTILNTNTIEEFKDLNKNQYLAKNAEKIIDFINNCLIEKSNYSALSTFELLCFADLKRFQFTYWFAFPAFHAFTALYNSVPKYASELFHTDVLNTLKNQIKFDFFIFEVDSNSNNVRILSSIYDAKLDTYFGFVDSCNHSEYPGWALRNFIVLIAKLRPELLCQLKIFCFRLHIENNVRSIDHSLILNLNVKLKEEPLLNCVVGWERNNKDNFGPKIADLHSSMDPITLSENAVDLNLKLMKWQLAPELNVETNKLCKCLILGAGTLGCAVARSLLAWGFKHVTFVDKAKVSYSNPVRQCLYGFKHVGSVKAVAAADALKDIHPSVISEGWDLTIPMPGHPVGSALLNEMKNSFFKLEQLIVEHDVIFLLLDSRESRWLPTVLAAAHQKIVINAALGFESYLVMRHGLKSNEPNSLDITDEIPGSQLGCYFCNDVTAPGNSLQGRTLDQQCTVTRPGVSSIAGALAVELLVSILQHSNGAHCPALINFDPNCEQEYFMGVVPHSIRGYLNNYKVLLPATIAFNSCVGCSPKVINEYIKDGFDFVLKVLESSCYLEIITGLDELHKNLPTDDWLEYCDDISDNSENTSEHEQKAND